MRNRLLFCLLLLLLLPGSAPAEEAELRPCPMPVYVNGERAPGEEDWIFIGADGHFYADTAVLCGLTAQSLVTRTPEGAWMLRRVPLEADAVLLWDGRALLDLERACFCLRVDPYWLEAGVFSLLERFSPVLDADGMRFERTGGTAPAPLDGWDAVSPEGRAMWKRGESWWLEDGLGLIWRYAPAEGTEETEAE